MIQRKSYQLSAVEETLATLSPLFSSAYDLYGTTKMLDVHFHPFEHDGITYPYATFENEYEDTLILTLDSKVLNTLVMLYVNISNI